MDLSTITPESREVKILHPKTQEPTGLVFKLLPLTHAKVKAVERRIRNARLNSRKLKVTAEQMEAQNTELLAAAVEGWEWTGDSSFNGEKLAFTDANLRTVLKVDWIRQQVDEELGDIAGFFPDLQTG